jgi:hypothetical protein
MDRLTGAALGAIAVGVLGNYATRVIDLLVARAWERRAVVFATTRRVVLPSPQLQLQRVIVALVAALALATFADTLPPAVLAR